MEDAGPLQKKVFFVARILMMLPTNARQVLLRSYTVDSGLQYQSGIKVADG
jgi:hypothetical protein